MWNKLDHALAYATQTVEDFTDKFGLLPWELEDEASEVAVVKKSHKFQAAIDLATSGTEKKPYKPAPGEYYVPDLWSRRKDENGNYVFQTFTEWMQGKSAVE